MKQCHLLDIISITENRKLFETHVDMMVYYPISYEVVKNCIEVTCDLFIHIFLNASLNSQLSIFFYVEFLIETESHVNYKRTVKSALQNVFRLQKQKKFHGVI